MSSSKFTPSAEDQECLFPREALIPLSKRRLYKRVDHPIWSHNKARFIALYLKYFVQITHHGGYIDGFAGPQYPEHLEAWTASQVLASQPKWLRQFFLCDLDASKVAHLEALKAAQPPVVDRRGRKLPREVSIHAGDFNQTLEDILASPRLLKEKAVFCLIDQHTFECKWNTVAKVAHFRQAPQKKVELLYFLGVGWIHRAMSGLNDPAKLEPWWGRGDWNTLPDLSCFQLAELLRERLTSELGYKYTAAYPIFDQDHSNKIMYYMIHASDHEEAPALMVRAHSKAVRALPKETQSEFGFSTPNG